MASVCVMGGGPAGSIFAIRMAELGHQVDVVEAAAFPRPHLGESLSPGVQALLQSVGAAGALDDALPARNVEVAWDGPALIRKDEREEGLLVDRGFFDGALLDRARRLGVRVHQPARIVDRKQTENGWRLVIATAGGNEIRQVDFLADARGRAGATAWRRDTTGPATLALHAYWKGAALPTHPVIRAGDAAWYWAVPLPDGTCHLQVFVDAKEFGALPKATLKARYLELLGCSGFGTGLLQGPVQASDATPYVALNAATPFSIALGETALALDPLSSSGVQKAIQTALAGAVVANTLMKSGASAAAAMAFHETNLGAASTRHRKWATSYYAEAARERPDVFWRRRAGPAVAEAPRRPVVAADAANVASHRVELSRDIVIEDLPCIDGEFVTLQKALRHPGLAAPVAYLGNQPLAPLLNEIKSSATLVDIAQGWSHRMPFKSALSIAIWLRNNGVLVEARP
jgi:flavin-dependent dehydrogenase